MIDKINVYKEIDLPPKELSPKFRKIAYSSCIDFRTGEVLDDPYTVEKYVYRCNSFKISYYPKQNKLRVQGRLPNLTLTKNLVYNLDDYLIGVEKVVKHEFVDVERDATWLAEHTTYDADFNLIHPEQWELEEEIETVHENLEDVIGAVNEKLLLLTGKKLDIRTFKVTTIEVCFNLFDVEHVGHTLNCLTQSLLGRTPNATLIMF